MCPKNFDYESRNSNRAQDNEFYNFKDEFNRVNKVEEISSHLDIDVLTSGHEYNPYSQEITNASDDNKTNRAEEPSSSHTENLSNNTYGVKDAAKLQSVTNTTTSLVSNLQSVLLTATVAGGAAIGVVTAVTSPMIDVSLFSRTKEALVFEVETTNIEESDEVIAKLSKGDEVYEIKLEGQRFLSFEDLEENNEYTLEIRLNGDRKFRKNYMTVGPDIPVELTVGEYTRENLVFDVYKPDTYSFVTVTVYSDSKNYLAKDQTIELQHYSVTGINYHENIYISVTDESGKGLAFSEFASRPDIPDVTMSEVSDESRIEAYYAEFGLIASAEIDASVCSVKVNGYTASKYYFVADDDQPLHYTLVLEGLDADCPQRVEIYVPGQSNAAFSKTFRTPASTQVSFTQVSEVIEKTTVTYVFECSSEFEIDELRFMLNEEEREIAFDADQDNPGRYTLEIKGLESNSLYYFDIYLNGQSAKVFSSVFTTQNVIEITDYSVDARVDYAVIHLVFDDTLAVEDLVIEITNQNSQQLALYEVSKGQTETELFVHAYDLTPGETYVLDIYHVKTSTVLVQNSFTCLTMQFNELTDQTNITADDATFYYECNAKIESAEIKVYLDDVEIDNFRCIKDSAQDNVYILSITGLAEETEYRMRVSLAGNVILAERTFTTTQAPLEDITSASYNQNDSVIGRNTAEIVFTFNRRPLEDEITYVVTDASGVDIAAEISVSDGPGDTESKVTITGLIEDTTYIVKAYLTSESASGNPLCSAEITTKAEEPSGSDFTFTEDALKRERTATSVKFYFEYSGEYDESLMEISLDGTPLSSSLFVLEDNSYVLSITRESTVVTAQTLTLTYDQGTPVNIEFTYAEDPNSTGPTFSIIEKNRRVDMQSAIIYFEPTGECDKSKLVIMDNGITQDNNQFTFENSRYYSLMLYRDDYTVSEHRVTIDYDGTRIYETTITYSDDQQGTTTDLEFNFELDGSGASSTSPLRITYVIGTLPEGGSTGPNINVTVQRDGVQVGSSRIAIDGDQNTFAEIDIDGERDPTGANLYTYEGTYTIIMWDINKTEQIYSTEIQLP